MLASCLMGKALKRLKNNKGHSAMVHSTLEKNCCDSSKDECIQNTCGYYQFDNVYSWFKNEGNSSGENSATSTDFVTYQRWVREEGKIKKQTISKPKSEFEVAW